MASNNLGYFGPHEVDLRPVPWSSCSAGRWVMGIEANGDIKGCPSLPSAPYVGGNVRDTPLRTLWEQSAILGFTRERDLGELWGFCGTCYYKEVCKGGCSWTSHATLGRRGNMPWCHHRAETLAAHGRRERLVKVEAAPGRPFDFGRFELVEEDLPAASQT
jgi:radical SAM protein with 4Fe4S-binding SPASM domain